MCTPSLKWLTDPLMRNFQKELSLNACSVLHWWFTCLKLFSVFVVSDYYLQSGPNGSLTTIDLQKEAHGAHLH